MASQSAFSSLCYTKIKSSNQRLFLDRICSTSGVISRRKQTFPSIYAEKRVATGLKWVKELPLCRVNSNRGVTVQVGASNSDDSADGLKLLKEGKPEPSPSEIDSICWTSTPVALFMSFSVSLLLAGCIRSVVTKDGLDAGIGGLLCREAAVYAGLASFLIIMDRAQSPYLQFSAGRLSLVSGLREYLSAAFLIKIELALVALYLTWPILGKDALVAVTPFLASCAAQVLFEISPKLRASSYWPLVPITIEVYRLHKLTGAAHSMNKLGYELARSKHIPQVSRAVLRWMYTFLVIGVICIWSLITFLLRLFPITLVGDKYSF